MGFFGARCYCGLMSKDIGFDTDGHVESCILLLIAC